MTESFTVDIGGCTVALPIIEVTPGVRIAFFNLHGEPDLTEHCAACLAGRLEGAEIVLTAESKGLQLAHCVARNLGHHAYAVARKDWKPYLSGGLSVEVHAITHTGDERLYVSERDAVLLQGKRVAVIDDVISTAGSLRALEALVEKAGGTVTHRAFVLAEGSAASRTDITYLASIPLF